MVIKSLTVVILIKSITIDGILGRYTRVPKRNVFMIHKKRVDTGFKKV